MINIYTNLIKRTVNKLYNLLIELKCTSCTHYTIYFILCIIACRIRVKGKLMPTVAHQRL